MIYRVSKDQTQEALLDTVIAVLREALEDSLEEQTSLRIADALDMLRTFKERAINELGNYEVCNGR